MNHYVVKFKDWLELRPQREQILIIIAMLALIYAIFTIFLLRPLETKKNELKKAAQTINFQIKNWQSQLNILSKIPETSLYKEWVTQHRSLKHMQSEYKQLLRTSSTRQWQAIIETILLTHQNISLTSIKNSPETIFSPVSTQDKLYQQQLNISANSNFFGLVHYLERLEKTLPYVHWNSLNYQVTAYPLATVEMEFSLIYEKNL